MTKPIGSLCNMDCSYCFYLEKEKLYPNTNHWVMNEKVLESYIRQYIRSQKVNEITFAWQGGEPTLLGVGYFKKVVQLQKTYADGKTINNTFQTNAVLIDIEWAEFFALNKFLVGVSIDGPSEIHDKYRVLKGGQPTFNKVLRGIKILKKHGVDFNTLTCVSKANEDEPLKVYHFLKEIGSGFIQFIPIVERLAREVGENDLKLVSPNYHKEAVVTEWSVDSLKYGKFLSAVFDEWVRKDVGKYYVQIFDIALEAWVGQRPSLCVFSDVCGNAMAMEHNGDLYSCDHYVYPENKLGSILTDLLQTMVNSGKQIRFGIDKKIMLPQYCRNCKYLFACNGECPKHRFTKTPDGEEELNYLCQGYKYFFNHIDAATTFMANELKNQRPPANVMKWMNIRSKN
ncbi:MAG TPA: anaerobic sulfatase maturase [Bacteroidetes bacterium]|nr:anaerobic sulfatase maturase [Bacteroidota bacterium]